MNNHGWRHLSVGISDSVQKLVCFPLSPCVVVVLPLPVLLVVMLYRKKEWRYGQGAIGIEESQSDPTVSWQMSERERESAACLVGQDDFTPCCRTLKASVTVHDGNTEGTASVYNNRIHALPARSPCCCLDSAGVLSGAEFSYLVLSVKLPRLLSFKQLCLLWEHLLWFLPSVVLIHL